MAKKAVITGITGQDGYYLANFLLNKGYEVYGMHRRSSLDIEERIADLRGKIKLVHGDVTDTSSLVNILQKVNPDEFYNLAAQSFVPDSWTQLESTAEITGLGVLKCLEAIRLTNRDIKFYQASSSEMFGNTPESPQNENSPFLPRSPYGFSKVFGYHATINYRESFGIHASNGILFNHESSKRGKQFVTRKISHSVAEIKTGKQDYSLGLGNLNAKRDWGYALDYVEAMWMMLQQEKPGDFVIGTGETHSVREFAEEAFGVAGITVKWEKKGVDERGYDATTGREIVSVDSRLFRPAEIDLLCADPRKARENIGWEPKTDFKGLVKIMVEHDIENLKGKTGG
jgi:GDPmannose 4,6-dehydratase